MMAIVPVAKQKQGDRKKKKMSAFEKPKSQLEADAEDTQDVNGCKERERQDRWTRADPGQAWERAQQKQHQQKRHVSHLHCRRQTHRCAG